MIEKWQAIIPEAIKVSAPSPICADPTKSLIGRGWKIASRIVIMPSKMGPHTMGSFEI
jgi:hypothetical protein